MAFPERLAIASRNAHKLRELGRICAEWPVEWVTVENHDPAAFPDVEETGDDLPRERPAEGDARSRPRSGLAGDRRRLRASRSTPWAARPGPRSRATPARTPPTSRTSTRCCGRCEGCRREVAPPGTDASRPSPGPTGARCTPRASCEGALVAKRRGGARVRLRPGLRARRLGRDDGRAHRRAEGPHQPPGPGVPRAARAARRGLSPLGPTAAATRLKVATPSVESSSVEHTTARSAVWTGACCAAREGFFDGKSPLLVAVLGLAFIAVVSVLDYLTGPRALARRCST